jgi:hypothetical protein
MLITKAKELVAKAQNFVAGTLKKAENARQISYGEEKC